MRGCLSVVSDRSSDTSDSNTYVSHEDEKVNDPDVIEDRFRVDRKKLEQMLQGEDENEAAKFFEEVMVKTNSVISWPTKLKIGAKSKKDPHIKVTGKLDAVREAKDLVMALLDTKSNRVTLKMDVPFTDHSHIIGRGGSNIKEVMTETGCHIHFPDSNRNNPLEKSNQVSIAGQPSDVELARSRIRELLPLGFSFDLPMNGFCQSFPDPQSQSIRHIQQMYGVLVQFRQRSQPYVSAVVVKGNEVDAPSVKEATQILMDFFVGQSGVQLPVTLTMEIAPQHHTAVKGRGNMNLKLIMQQTGTTITFPETDVPFTSMFQPRKGTVTITGSIEGVHLARQKLIGSLPLVLMFDLHDDCEPEPTFVTKVMERYDVYVSTKPKQKQVTKSVFIKGVERNSSNLFEARRHLLGVCDSSVEPLVPSAYSLNPSSFSNNGDCTVSNNSTDLSGLSLVKLGVFGHNILSTNTATIYHNPAVAPVNPKLSQTSTNGSWSCNEFRAYNPFQVPQFSSMLNSTPKNQIRSYVNAGVHIEKAPSVCSSTTSTLSSPNPSPRQGSPTDSSSAPFTNSVAQSTNTEKDAFEMQLPTYLTNSSIARLQELLEGQSRRVAENENGILNDECGILYKRSENCELDEKHQLQLVDYGKKKLLASKAMKQKPTCSQPRFPTDSWAGYGFSKSMPEPKEKLSEKLYQCRTKDVSIEEEDEKDVWKQLETNRRSSAAYPQPKLDMFNRSNYAEGSSWLHNCRKATDLGEVLRKIGLDKYLDLFQQQEIDFSTFLTMTDQDLKELGISTFGARRKMMIAIQDLAKQSFPVAPGAERTKPPLLRAQSIDTPSNHVSTTANISKW